jgi:hypothetical protein
MCLWSVTCDIFYVQRTTYNGHLYSYLYSDVPVYYDPAAEDKGEDRGEGGAHVDVADGGWGGMAWGIWRYTGGSGVDETSYLYRYPTTRAEPRAVAMSVAAILFSCFTLTLGGGGAGGWTSTSEC